MPAEESESSMAFEKMGNDRRTNAELGQVRAHGARWIRFLPQKIDGFIPAIFL